MINKQKTIFEITEFPLVSVIVPAFNAQQYIGETLQSIIRQSYPNLEIIVTDDGSIDRTADIVKKAMKKDRRILLLQQPNCGVAAARNLAIRQSRGNFIAPVDADDICFPDKIGKLVDKLRKVGKKIGLVYSWYVSINRNGNLVGQGHKPEFEGDVFEYLLFSNFMGNASTALIRRNCFDKKGLYNTTYFSQKAQGCEDYDLYLRIAESFEFKIVKEFLTGYRKTGHSMSDNYTAMERSRQLVFRDQKTRNPWIPDVVFNWAWAYYFFWLSSLAAKKGCYCDSLVYLFRSAYHDPALIKNFGYLRLLFSPLKHGLKNLFPPYFKFDTKKVYYQKLQQYIDFIEHNLLSDFEKGCNGIKSERSSLYLLKEKRRRTAYLLTKKARIKNNFTA